jgi:UDP-N-acetylglucosamine/UDP-N-acetylgalactosamine diphosphorylase
MFSSAFEKLSAMRQEHLLSHLHSLPSLKQKKLEEQILTIDLPTFFKQQLLLSTSFPSDGIYTPFLDFAYAENLPNPAWGKQLISEGKMGCLLLAGGQGSRLSFDGPKGLYPISVIKQKSLFQLCAEKVLAASKQAGRPLLLAIMLSSENEKETKQFFQQHAFFGLSPPQLFFFTQGSLPLLDEKGNLFLDSADHLAEGPNGNGFALRDFVQSGIWSKWHQQGIRYLNVILIDNPLADPFDAKLVEFHHNRQVDITVKCTEKQTPTEKVGVLVNQEGQVRVVEYSEMDTEEKAALAEDGRLKHRCANLSLFCFSMDFVQRAAEKSDTMPLHKAWKAAKYLASDGSSQKPLLPNAWKFEAFIFDLFLYTSRLAALLYPRSCCFSPLKNAAGEDSPETVKRALQNRDCEIIKEITGHRPAALPLELEASFYYPTEKLLKKWKGKVCPSGYVTEDSI